MAKLITGNFGIHVAFFFFVIFDFPIISEIKLASVQGKVNELLSKHITICFINGFHSCQYQENIEEKSSIFLRSQE